MRDAPPLDQRLWPQLNEQQRQLVGQAAVVRSCRKGQTLFQQGDLPSKVFMIEKGTFKLCQTTGCGRDIIWELLQPGDICGCLCALSHFPYTSRAEAVMPARVRTLTLTRFEELLQLIPALRQMALITCSRKHRRQQQLAADITMENVETRLARAIYTMHSDNLPPYQLQTPKGGIPLILNRRELSEYIGTTTETVIRIISQWKKKQIISLQKGHIEDPDTLESLPFTFMIINRPQAMEALVFKGRNRG